MNHSIFKCDLLNFSRDNPKTRNDFNKIEIKKKREFIKRNVKRKKVNSLNIQRIISNYQIEKNLRQSFQESLTSKDNIFFK